MEHPRNRQKKVKSFVNPDKAGIKTKMQTDFKKIRCLIVGNDAETHLGGYFKSAAIQLGIDTEFFNVSQSWASSKWLNRFSWNLCGRKPFFLNRFSKQVLERAIRSRRNFILTTGIAPLSATCLKKLKEKNIVTVNYLTDDPFNPAHRAAWFLESVKNYTLIASQRRGNIEDLKKHGCAEVVFLPFAYDPETHYPVLSQEKEDVVFVGGADPDRIPYFKRLVKEGFSLALYGGYWNRYSEFKPFYKGFANSKEGRQAIGGGKISICLVRDANRDDNSMRTFETAAMGGCMLVKDTPYHRELFGAEMQAVAYFSDSDELVERLKLLLADQTLRSRLRTKVVEIMKTGKHTYLDRLTFILEKMSGEF